MANMKKSPSADTQRLQQLRELLISHAKSEATATILRTATIGEIRGIKNEIVHTNVLVNGTLMEWATVVLAQAVHHKRAPVGANAFQWKHALLLVHATLKHAKHENPEEKWMRAEEARLLLFFRDFYEATVQQAELFLLGAPDARFFNGMLCFASHYAKHALPKRMTVAHYLRKAVMLLQRTPHVDGNDRVYSLRGWHLYVAGTEGDTYIKSLHWKTPNKY